MSHEHRNHIIEVLNRQITVARQHRQGLFVGPCDEGSRDSAPPVVVGALSHGTAVDQRAHLVGDVVLQVVGTATVGHDQVDAPHLLQHAHHVGEPSLVLKRGPGCLKVSLECNKTIVAGQIQRSTVAAHRKSPM